MRRCYQYRLYPTRAQTAKLVWTLDRCREVYNAALEERREAYRMCGASVGYYEQKRQLPAIKEVRPEYRQIGSQVLQDVTRRLDLAFQAFFQRVAAIKALKAKGVKTDKKAGYPRFKSKYRYNSFTLAQAGWKRGERLHITGIGAIKVKWSRPIEGTIKTVTVKRDVDQWYVCFSCEVERPAPAETPDRPAVGIDLGLEYYATLSDGTHIENPRYYRKAQEVIARRDRSMRRKRKGGKSRANAGILLKKAHRKVANQRKDMQHKAACKLVQTYGALAVEDLNLVGMVRNPMLAKSISDAGWAQFLSILTAKAEEAGCVMVRVNPSGTSQACSGCGAVCRKTLADRWHTCEHCGLSLQRDHNAALNILARAGLARPAA